MAPKKTNSIKADFCIIGAGAGGLSLAAGTAQLGLKAVLIEQDKMGGDCLYSGCVPSKSLLYAARSGMSFNEAKTHMKKVIAQIEPHDSIERFEGLGVTVIKGTAKFLDSKTIAVNEQTIAAKYFVIATGSRAIIPPIEGIDEEKTLTNENIFALKERPDHLIIIGGGPIGMEMGQLYKNIGSQVTIIEQNTILPKDDRDLADVLRQKLIVQGIILREQATVQKITYDAKGAITLHTAKDSFTGSHLLVAAGRKPVLDALNLEAAGVKYDARGIASDQILRTSQKHIFAIGDAAGGVQFTHAANYHAGLIIQKAVFKSPFARINYTALPWVTYTDPEVAQVGLTESAARKKFGDAIQVLRAPYADNDRARAENIHEGVVKIILHKKKIIGAGIAGQKAGELISLWGLAIGQKIKLSAIAGMIMPYPTLSELSKRAAGSYFSPILFGDRTRKLVQWLKILP